MSITETNTESNPTNSTLKKVILIVFAIAAVIFVCIKLYNNRKIDSLDGFWESRGNEHYVAYVHGDTMDIFWFEDRAETQVASWYSGFRLSGHFTPPEPGFNNYAWDLIYDYNRTSANFVESGIVWHASQNLSFETDPLEFRFEYKDGKIIRYYDDGGTEVFYPSSSEHLEVDMQVAIYDMQHEISQLAVPLEVGIVKELPLADGSNNTLLFVEVTNPNIFRINDPEMLFYDQPGDAERGECNFSCFIDAAYHAVLVTTNNWTMGTDASHSELVYSEYGISIPDFGSDNSVKAVSSTVLSDSVEVNVHTDVFTKPDVYKAAVVFYLGDEIVGGGYDFFTLDSTDMTIPVPILTELSDYDSYDVFIY